MFEAMTWAGVWLVQRSAALPDTVFTKQVAAVPSTFDRITGIASGVLTILWHDRSHGPERFWGDFYARLLGELKSLNPWFATGGRVTDWFRQRREVVFEYPSAHGPDRLKVRYPGERVDPPLTLRVHCPNGSAEESHPVSGQACRTTDIPWTGESEVKFAQLLREVSGPPAQTHLAPVIIHCTCWC